MKRVGTMQCECSSPEIVLKGKCLFYFRELNVNDLQMKELQDQLEAENYFSVSGF